jgi:hypothetical protein
VAQECINVTERSSFAPGAVGFWRPYRARAIKQQTQGKPWAQPWA